ncbi:amidohydrolase family protein [Defluviitalea phaphyphila]|uniref:amidohydrolase family protein n=1 Tax=Defluviitalea phaphyphila TaxID=1473580 RepID=UPI00072FF1EC|nr:amidohydrolase family protein [Defluviitalea phaphyphila]
MDKKAIFASRMLLGKELDIKENWCILIKGETIIDILPQSSLSNMEYEGWEIIDLGNVTLMPGMIDCHNHLALDARLKNHLEMMNKSAVELTLLGVNSAQDDLMSGVTTARYMGDRFYMDIIFRREIELGNLIGPHILASGIGMRALHGHGYVGMPFTGVDEFRKATRENMAQGVDLLKIFVTGGTLPEKGEYIPCYMTLEEISTVVKEGRALGLKTSAHCIGGQGLKNCIKAGVDIIEHAYAITEEEVELIKKEDRWIDLTPGIFMDESREQFLSPKSAEKIRKQRNQVIECLKRVIKGNVKFTLGSDAYHTYLYREVEYAVELGADSKKAIQGVTSNAALMLGIETETGSLSKGLRADIIAVEGNPLEDVSLLSKVKFVMKSGKIFKNIVKNGI